MPFFTRRELPQTGLRSSMSPLLRAYALYRCAVAPEPRPMSPSLQVRWQAARTPFSGHLGSSSPVALGARGRSRGGRRRRLRRGGRRTRWLGGARFLALSSLLRFVERSLHLQDVLV